MRSMSLLFLYKLPRKPVEVKFLWSKEGSGEGGRQKAKGERQKAKVESQETEDRRPQMDDG
jgi:hypothetical protein